jgi:hypothetical protein
VGRKTQCQFHPQEVLVRNACARAHGKGLRIYEAQTLALILIVGTIRRSC